MKKGIFLVHSYNASNDPAIKRLIKKYSFEAYGIFWRIVDLVTESGPATIAKISKTVDCESKKVKIITDFCVSEKLLSVTVDNKIFTNSKQNVYKFVHVK